MSEAERHWQEGPEPEQTNPYAVPATAAGDLGTGRVRAAGEFDIASRGLRLAAVVVDTLLPGIVIVVAAMVIAVLEVSVGATSDVRLSTGQIVLLVGLLAVWGVINLILVATRSQTVGKAVVGIQIATPDGRRASFGRIILLRWIVPGVIYLVISVLSSVAQLVVFLVDHLRIFSPDHRCLHDLLAGTIVIRRPLQRRGVRGRRSNPSSRRTTDVE